MTQTLILATALGLPVGADLSAHAEQGFALFGEEHTASGTIKSVDAGSSKFVLTTSDGDKTISVTNSTKYTLDGKDAAMADALKVGYTARVTHSDAKASLVAVTSGKKQPN
jgi:hypothetical protein